MREALTERVRDPVQAKSAVYTGYEDIIAAARAPDATRIPGPVQTKMERALGADFSEVRVRLGSTRAAELGALAFTQGNEIHMAPGQWAPETTGGQELLGHELGHVVQQRTGRVRPTAQRNGVGLNDEQSLEAEADAMGARAARAEVAGQPPTACPTCGGTPASVQRKCESCHQGTPKAPQVAGAAGAPVQRKLRVAGADLDAAGVKNLTTDAVKTKLADIVPKVVSADLVSETIREMQAVSDVLDFADADAVASDVRHRVLVSHYMRQSQGSSPTRKAFSYPDRKGDGTTGVGPKVNDAASAYWGPVHDWSGDYYFDLSPAGLANPYQALVTLFTEQTDPHKRTLIHCDYVVSMLEFRAYAENIGAARFNMLVASGALSMRLKYDGFTELLKQPALTTPPLPLFGPLTIPMAPTAPLQEVTVSSKSDLIVGDHVVFYNHETYDALIERVPDVWRLENAIVIDRVGGQLRYQGHGYFSPVTEDVLLHSMIGHYNRRVDDALGLIYRSEHGTASARAAAAAELADKYPNVKRKTGGSGWEVRGKGICETIAARDLKHLTVADAPALVDPCSGTIQVRRPVERIP